MAKKVPDDDGSNLPPLEITAPDLADDTETQAGLLIEYLRRLGVDLVHMRGTFDTARRILMAERRMQWAAVRCMSGHQIIAELREVCVERGLLGDNSPEADHKPKGTLELKPVKAGQGDTSMSLAFQKAGASLEWVRRERPDLTPAERSDERYTTDEYDYISEQGCDAYPEDDKGRSTVPNWDTWSRYIREYLKHTQGPANAPRAGRPIGRSVSRQADV